MKTVHLAIIALLLVGCSEKPTVKSLSTEKFRLDWTEREAGLVPCDRNLSIDQKLVSEFGLEPGIENYWRKYGSAKWRHSPRLGENSGEWQDLIQAHDPKVFKNDDERLRLINKSLRQQQRKLTRIFVVGTITGVEAEDIYYAPEDRAYYQIANGIDGPKGDLLGFNFSDLFSEIISGNADYSQVEYDIAPKEHFLPGYYSLPKEKWASTVK